MLTSEQLQTTPHTLFVPQQLGRASLVVAAPTTKRGPSRPETTAFSESFRQFLHIEPWHVPLAREVIHFIRMSDLAYFALRKSLALPQNRMPADLVESVYAQDQAAVSVVLKDIGGLPVRVENSAQGLDVWMRMVEWQGVSKTETELDPTIHTWLPRGQEGTGNTVELGLDALAEMEHHVTKYQVS